jgi:hypothetical protein
MHLLVTIFRESLQCSNETINSIRIFWSSSLLCRNRMKRTAGFNTKGRRPKLRKQLVYCKSSLMSPLFSVAFGHLNLQTLSLQISIYGDFWKKGFILITHKALRNWSTILNRLWPILAEKHLGNSRKTHYMVECLSSTRYWTKSASAGKLFCKFFLTIKN